MALKLRAKPLSAEEFYLNLQGRTNSQIINYLLGREASVAELEAISEEKEALYRERCTAPDGLFDLAPGVEAFLNKIKPMQIPFTIATGSYRRNVEFYFNHLKLERWFHFNQVVFDDGTYPGKPAPDIFLKAAAMIGIEPKNCLVFEDSYAGIRSALAADIGRIITVEASLDANKVQQLGQVYKMVESFNEIDLDDLS
jgi:HAD superfamily hydrolase (TIGR01509 family)